jgi:dihydroxyacid dehydratase/phosphogluconate dehydratase
MDARTNFKSQPLSRHVTEAAERAPHRSYRYAMGPTAASGGSTNLALHLPAIAHEFSGAFTLFDVADVFKRTPCIALPINALLDHGYLHGECITVTGYTVAEKQKSVQCNPRHDVDYPADKPITVTGGVVGLTGNLAPEGAGYLWKYAQQVGPAIDGAVTRPGGAAGKQSHADA